MMQRYFRSGVWLSVEVYEADCVIGIQQAKTERDSKARKGTGNNVGSRHFYLIEHYKIIYEKKTELTRTGSFIPAGICPAIWRCVVEPSYQTC